MTVSARTSGPQVRTRDMRTAQERCSQFTGSDLTTPELQGEQCIFDLAEQADAAICLIVYLAS